MGSHPTVPSCHGGLGLRMHSDVVLDAELVAGGGQNKLQRPKRSAVWRRGPLRFGLWSVPAALRPLQYASGASLWVLCVGASVWVPRCGEAASKSSTRRNAEQRGWGAAAEGAAVVFMGSRNGLLEMRQLMALGRLMPWQRGVRLQPGHHPGQHRRCPPPHSFRGPAGVFPASPGGGGRGALYTRESIRYLRRRMCNSAGVHATPDHAMVAETVAKMTQMSR